MEPGPSNGRSGGLSGLRRGGTLAELLFLYDCVTEESSRLRPIARRLGVSVQAISHTYRQLARRGLAELREGRYRPTLAGVAWLHRALEGLAEDVFRRQRDLHIIRSTRAVAGTDLAAGEVVTLQMVDGSLTAFPGRSDGSRGRSAGSARRGSLAEIRDLEGILPLQPAEIHVVTLPAAALNDPALPRRIRDEIATTGSAIVASLGLEAYHAVHRAYDGPVVRFAPAPASREAAQVGVGSTIFVLDEELPRLLAQFPGPEPPRLRVRPLRSARRPARRRPRANRRPPAA